MYLTFFAPTKYRYCITACFWVWCDSQNKQKIFRYTAVARSLL